MFKELDFSKNSQNFAQLMYTIFKKEVVNYANSTNIITQIIYIILYVQRTQFSNKYMQFCTFNENSI